MHSTYLIPDMQPFELLFRIRMLFSFLEAQNADRTPRFLRQQYWHVNVAFVLGMLIQSIQQIEFVKAAS